MTATDLNEVNPSQEDGVARGVSELVGGPVGEHAATRHHFDRVLTPVRVLMALAAVVFVLHWVQKAPCQDGMWENHEQYSKMCYTDIVALYYAEHLNDGAVPYFDWPVEYPVLTGYFMGLLGLPVHDIGAGDPTFNQGQAFYNLNLLVLSAFGVAAIAVVLALRRRRPWDALLFVLAPTLVLTATVNWDLLAIGLTAFFLYAWARRRPVLAGVMLGLATAAKLYPVFLVGALIVLALRTARVRAAAVTVATGVATWVLVNAPVFLFANAGWDKFWQLSSTRAVDWGTFWYIGAHFPLSTRPGGGIQPFVSLSNNIGLLNALSYFLFGLGCLAVLLVGLRAPLRPRLAQLCFLLVALFLLTSKVWSQQFVLWLIPLAVLARPRWGAFLFWQATELCYFLAFYAHLLNLDGMFVMPEAAYVYASMFRWIGLAVLVGMVFRDVLRPERDVVRMTYGDDPDGGDFAGAPDYGVTVETPPWLARLLESGREAARSVLDNVRTPAR
jgi:uncharacterized membrane protein